jgi:hypothetical protein
MIARYKRTKDDGTVYYWITEQVGRHMLKELGCLPVKYQKGIYYWGACKPDVLAEKAEFIRKYRALEVQLPHWVGFKLKMTPMTTRGVYWQESRFEEGHMRTFSHPNFDFTPLYEAFGVDGALSGWGLHAW